MRKVKLTIESFFIFVFGLLIIGFVLFFLQGCSYPMPKVDVTFWAGDPSIGGVSRSQDNEHMVCTDQSFDNYACLTYQDIKNLYNAMLQCKQWGPPVMSEEQAKYEIKKNQEVVKHVLSQPQ